MGCNDNFRHSRECNRFWDDLMFCRHRQRDCDDRRRRHNHHHDCDCDECRRRRNHHHNCDCDDRRDW
ncbi:hypothetical protein [Bacillus sp. LK2]|uniref:hypothetical protein n=1 Tax=Bacillus sp. LK2 TaxID=1628206 RepID=UPI0009E41F8C|nr:hypothetical protein [Bacillus sp. LK2]